MPADTMKLKRTFEALRTDRSSLSGTWDQIERYILPISGKTYTQDKDAQTDSEAWDFTASLANEHLAAMLGANVTPAGARWFGFEWQDPELREDRDALAYLEKLTNLTWSEIRNSDFSMEIGAGYLEYSGYGNMALVVEPTSTDRERWEGFDFTCVPVKECYFEEDSRGGVETFFRHLRWTPVQIRDRFQTAERLLPQRIVDAAVAGGDRANEPLDVVFAIFRREGIKEQRDEKTGKRLLVAPELRPHGYCYFILESGEQLGDEGGYYEMPAVVGRWARKPGMAWGFGRGNIALRSVKYLCTYLDVVRAAAEKVADPAHLVTERGLLSDVNLEPGGQTVVGDVERDMKVFESGARFDVSNDVIRDLRMEIRRLFHEDDLQLKESPQMTATEVQARRDLMDRSLGAPVGRLQTDVLSPMLRIILGHLERAGKLPPVPDQVQRKKAEIAVTYFGAISRAQRVDEVAAIERGAAFVASLVKSDPEHFGDAALVFDPVQAVREAFQRLGTPAKVLKSDDQVRKEREQRMAAMARAQQAQAAMAEAKAAESGAKAEATLRAAGAAAAPALGGAGLAMAPQPALLPQTGLPAGIP